MLWTKVYGTSASERGVNVVENINNEIIISAASDFIGNSSNDFTVVNTSSLGNVNWAAKYGGSAADEVDYWGDPLALSNDTGTILVGGTKSFGAIGEDIYIVKSNQCGESFCNEQVVTVSQVSPTLTVSNVTPINSSGGSPVNTNTSVSNISFSENILCIDTLSQNFQCNVTANFTASQFCEGDSTNFTDLSIDSMGTITNWQWYFGDGDSIIGVQNPAHLYLTSGNYNVTLAVTTDSNCVDSVTIPITINPIFSINRNDTICQGDSILLGGGFQNTAGVYTDSLQTTMGCDSIINTTLIVNSVYSSVQNNTICQGDSILFNGSYYANTGVYTDSLQTINGCDSLLSLNLIVNPIYQVNQSVTICDGDSILLGGVIQTTSGNYTDSLQTTMGCDSLITTTLSVANVYNDTINTSICQGDSIFLDGNYQTTAGIYTDSLQSVYGCDSVVTTNLTVDTLVTLVVPNDTTVSPCEEIQLNVSGGNSYSWTPIDYLSCSNCFNPIASPPITTTYTVSDPSSSCTLSNSFTVFVNGDAQFFIPNVFTPNGDGYNDLFNVSSECIYSLEKKIYNRWGQLLFESSQINEGWDGRTSSGKEVPQSTYFYIIKVEYYVNGIVTYETYTGYVSLLR